MSFTKAKITSTGLIALLAAITPTVNAHGYTRSVSISTGGYFDGLMGDWQKADGTAILVTDYLTPNYNVESLSIACGTNPKAASKTAEVSPGSVLNWRWITHDDNTDQPQKHWTHNEGTHRSFIGPCIGSCSSTDPNQVEWTELSGQYVGQQTWNGNSWPVSTLASGNTWSVSIPDLPAGDYLVRDELTALHYSTQPYQDYDAGLGHGYGTEFYPTCMAITVRNNGGGSFDMSRAVKFPGAYSRNTPGHYNPNLWADPGSVIVSATNTFARTGSVGNGGGSSGGDTGSSGDNGGSTGGGNTGSTGDNGGNGTTTPGSGQGCPARRRKRSAKFRRSHHHARSH